MTDRDKVSEGFLERWSRKKIDAERDAPAAPAEPGTEDAPPADRGSPERHSKADVKTDTNTPAEAAAKPEFDLASLPSLDSITAATDIRAFLAPGVPTELARAALRRAWAADPSIRNFKGLAENDWDFTDPTAMPGFGALPPGTDIKKMLAQIFGEGEKPTDSATAGEKPANSEASVIAGESAPPVAVIEGAPPSGEDVDSTPPNVSASEQQVSPSDLVHRTNIAAMHTSSSQDEIDDHKNLRRHGGALPQ